MKRPIAQRRGARAEERRERAWSRHPGDPRHVAPRPSPPRPQRVGDVRSRSRSSPGCSAPPRTSAATRSADLFSGGRHVDDFPGPGTGSVSIQVSPGDSVTTIGTTLVDAGVSPPGTRSSTPPPATRRRPRSSRARTSSGWRCRRPARSACWWIRRTARSSWSRCPRGCGSARRSPRLADGAGVPLAELEAAAADRGRDRAARVRGRQGRGFPLPGDVRVRARRHRRRDAGHHGHPVRPGRDRPSRSRQGAAALGRTPLEIVTIASIIEGETSRAEDMAKVARVIYNRLADGMRLQMDSTVSLRGRQHRQRLHHRRGAPDRQPVQHVPVSRACRPDRSAPRVRPRWPRRWHRRPATGCTS